MNGSDAHMTTRDRSTASGTGFPTVSGGSFQRCMGCGTDEAIGAYCTWCRTGEYELIDHRHGSGRDSCPLGTYRNPGKALDRGRIAAALTYNRANPPDLDSPFVVGKRHHPRAPS